VRQGPEFTRTFREKWRPRRVTPLSTTVKQIYVTEGVRNVLLTSFKIAVVTLGRIWNANILLRQCQDQNLPYPFSESDLKSRHMAIPHRSCLAVELLPD
jgi:hypothetical protein